MKKSHWLVGMIALTLAVPAFAQRKSQTGIFGAGQPGEVTVVRMEAKKLGLKHFEMESRQVDGRLAIDAFTAQIGGGTMQGRGLVDWSRPDELQHMTIYVRNVDAMALFGAFKVNLDAQIAAKSNAVIDTQWRGVRGSTPRQTMSGTVKIQLGPGTIVGAEVLGQVAAYTGIANLQQFRFQSAALEGTIRDGVMSITKADLTGAMESANGMGVLDLRTERVRIRFHGSVSPALLKTSTMPQVRALGSAASVAGEGTLIKIPLPVTMTGQVRDPQFSLAWERQSAKTDE